jgi:deoxyribodipyrimidine photo-lyase
MVWSGGSLTGNELTPALPLSVDNMSKALSEDPTLSVAGDAGRRARTLSSGTRGGPVIYWMSRDQRSADNWALWHAYRMAMARKVDLRVAFCLVPDFLGATETHYRFMLKGLRELDDDLARRGVPFDILQGDPTKVVSRYLSSYDVGGLVMDFDPLRIKTRWCSDVVEQVGGECVQVDAHNVVPCWVASPKKEYGAATLRPKLGRLIPEFIGSLPGRVRMDVRPKDRGSADWARLLRPGPQTGSDQVGPTPGERAARGMLEEFISVRLKGYAERRNDPNVDGQSDLSPYLHFGMIGAQRVALEVRASDAPSVDKDAFLEELIVRRELSDNLCNYDRGYDTAACLPSWAQITLRQHESDHRDYRYDLDELEGARTHDPLWNAAQTQMVSSGKMHGYLRMYWAKKILEWSSTAEEAMSKAITLNDRYELDGRDPNGYAGIAWSIGGLHDRAWPQRPIFGKVRSMTYNGARHKFDVDRYVERWSGGPQKIQRS